MIHFGLDWIYQRESCFHSSKNYLLTHSFPFKADCFAVRLLCGVLLSEKLISGKLGHLIKGIFSTSEEGDIILSQRQCFQNAYCCNFLWGGVQKNNFLDVFPLTTISDGVMWDGVGRDLLWLWCRNCSNLLSTFFSIQKRSQTKYFCGKCQKSAQESAHGRDKLLKNNKLAQ